MYHNKLNIKFWDERGLRPEVKDKLLQIGTKWAEFAKIPSTAVKDMILVGGNANYNYTRFSDLDLHLVVDKSQIADCPELLDDYLRDKKKLASPTSGISPDALIDWISVIGNWIKALDISADDEL